jgi:diguanylate cyclase
MNNPSQAPSILDLYPEETREAAALLKKAVPLMMRHDIPPNPVHYALWYTYCKGLEPELNRRLDKTVSDFDCFPPKQPPSSFATTSSTMNWKWPAPGSNR